MGLKAKNRFKKNKNLEIPIKVKHLAVFLSLVEFLNGRMGSGGIPRSFYLPDYLWEMTIKAYQEVAPYVKKLTARKPA